MLLFLLAYLLLLAQVSLFRVYARDQWRHSTRFVRDLASHLRDDSR